MLAFDALGLPIFLRFFRRKFLQDLFHQGTGAQPLNAHDLKRLINEPPALGLIESNRLNHIEFGGRPKRRRIEDICRLRSDLARLPRKTRCSRSGGQQLNRSRVSLAVVAFRYDAESLPLRVSSGVRA